jgi:hypothetical protein
MIHLHTHSGWSGSPDLPRSVKLQNPINAYMIINCKKKSSIIQTNDSLNVWKFVAFKVNKQNQRAMII